MKHGYAIEVTGYGNPEFLFWVGNAHDLKPSVLRKRVTDIIVGRGGYAPDSNNLILISKLSKGKVPRRPTSIVKFPRNF